MIKKFESAFYIGALLLFFLVPLECAGAKEESMRTLFLGNSVFYYRGGLMPGFEGFCHASGVNAQAVSQWESPEEPHGVEFLNYGRIPLNLPEVAADENIHALIRSGGFDYVIVEARRSGYLLPEWVELPDHRGESISYERNLEALKKLHRSIVESGAQTVLYMHPGMHSTQGVKHLLAQVYQRLHSDLEAMEINGSRRKVVLVPAMHLWLDALKRYDLDEWYSDENHGTPLARYASACILYVYLTGHDPRRNDYRELVELGPKWETLSGENTLSLAAEDEKWIKELVWLYYSKKPE